jgi:hypothetical protein
MARALAIVGMVMVHIGPRDLPGGGLSGAAYRATHGRAAIVFIVLAGIGVSLMASGRSPGDLPRVRGQLAWRALILLPAGLMLQTLDTGVAVILQYYAAYFLVAMLALGLRDRTLLVVAACSATLGPFVLIVLERAVPTWFLPGVADWRDVARVARDIAITGYYPVIVWTAPLLIGMWVGRRDLRSPLVARTVAATGAGLAAVAFVTSGLLEAFGGPATSTTDWRQLYMIEPHNEMPLWVLASTGIALAVIGGCVLLARRLSRATWPFVALGQLALTAYIVHLLVLHLWPHWLRRDAYGTAWVAITLFTGAALLLATAYRAVARRGPFELLLRPSALLAPAAQRPDQHTLAGGTPPDDAQP